MYCALCAAPHLTSQHDLLAAKNLLVPAVDIPHCINCFAAGLSHNHMASSRDCPFFLECNNCTNITSLLNLIWDRRMEGHENPFGATRVRSISSGSSGRSTAALPVQKQPSQPARINNYYPCCLLFLPSLSTAKPAPYGLTSQVLPPSDSSSSMKLISPSNMAMASSS